MAMILREAQPRPVPQTATGSRRDPRAAAQARLSGALLSTACTNPVDLKAKPFSQVSHIGFEDEGTVRVVEFLRADDDDLDW